MSLVAGLRDGDYGCIKAWVDAVEGSALSKGPEAGIAPEQTGDGWCGGDTVGLSMNASIRDLTYRLLR